MIKEINKKFQNSEIELNNIDKLIKFPELILMIEQKSNSIFKKDESINYIIGKICYYCKKSTILTINCKCSKAYYK